MFAPVTALYASLLGILIVVLAIRVSKTRQKQQVNLGDGGKDPMLRAIRMHGNAVEYVPLTLLLMLVFEINGGSHLLLHVAGVALIVSRLLHAWGLSQSSALTPGRLAGTAIGWALPVALAVSNLLRIY
jgi:uncharacterized membrane protein YecN with MAPEG domain